MTTDTQRLPRMEIIHRVLDLPTIEFALSKSASTYSRVKDSYQLLNWALSTAEYSLTRATKQAVPIAVPIARKFKTPIHFVDHTLCLGLNKIEEKVPLVKEQPEQVQFFPQKFISILNIFREYEISLSFDEKKLDYSHFTKIHQGRNPLNFFIYLST